MQHKIESFNSCKKVKWQIRNFANWTCQRNLFIEKLKWKWSFAAFSRLDICKILFDWHSFVKFHIVNVDSTPWKSWLILNLFFIQWFRSFIFIKWKFAIFPSKRTNSIIFSVLHREAGIPYHRLAIIDVSNKFATVRCRRSKMHSLTAF